MVEKKCFRRGDVKSLSEFYEHKRMKDGHLNQEDPWKTLRIL